jgi:hypothetical protein
MSLSWWHFRISPWESEKSISITYPADGCVFNFILTGIMLGVSMLYSGIYILACTDESTSYPQWLCVSVPHVHGSNNLKGFGRLSEGCVCALLSSHSLLALVWPFLDDVCHSYTQIFGRILFPYCAECLQLIPASGTYAAHQNHSVLLFFAVTRSNCCWRSELLDSNREGSRLVLVCTMMSIANIKL